MDIVQKIQNRIIFPGCLAQYERKNKHKSLINTQSTLLIFSNPRGGSTWLAEVLNELPKSVIVHEPFRRGRLKEFNELNFYWHQPIPSHANWPEARLAVKKLLNREILRYSLYAQNKIWEIPKAQYFIYKICHGNMLLAWLVDEFPVLPILITRHPCAVVASQMEHGGWEDIKNGANISDIPNFKFNEYYLQYQDILKSVSSVEENLAATWAMTMIHSVLHPYNDKKWITVAYESLTQNFEYELSRIFSRLQLPISHPEKFFARKNIPSKSTSPSAYKYISSGKQLSKWKNHLSSKQQKNILSIIKEFDIKFYDKNLEPDYSRIYTIR